MSIGQVPMALIIEPALAIFTFSPVLLDVFDILEPANQETPAGELLALNALLRWLALQLICIGVCFSKGLDGYFSCSNVVSQLGRLLCGTFK